jgi:hypothetical protein
MPRFSSFWVSRSDKYQPIQRLGERGDETVRRIGITLCLAGLVLAALAALGGASASSHVSRSDFKSASKYCKALRAELGGKAFTKKFHAKRVRGAHRRCVKRDGAVRALAPVTSFPPPADVCTPATEPAFPVRAFAGGPCAQPAPVTCDEDDAQGEHEDADDQGDDDATQNSDAATCDDSSGDDGNEAGDDQDEHHSNDSDDGDSDDD